jgi:hypothetical protein
MEKQKEILINLINTYIKVYDRETELNKNFKIDLHEFTEGYYEVIELALELTPFVDDINWWIWEFKHGINKKPKAYVKLKNGKKIDITTTEKFVNLLLSKNYEQVKEWKYE